jgi:ferric-dicitrate binding protein FerR (iron transport regulator)
MSSTKTTSEESEHLRSLATLCAKAAPKVRLAPALGRARSLVLLLVLLLAVSLAHSDEPVGSIHELRGTAQVFRAAKMIAAAVGMFVILGDRIETRADSELTLILRGGTRLRLGEDSTVIIDRHLAENETHLQTKVRLLLGKLRSWVNDTEGRGSVNFEVHTPNGVAAARGTDFEVDFIEGKPCPADPSCLRYTTVGVYQGVVVVANPTSPAGSLPVTLTAGYETTIPCESPPTPPSRWGAEELRAPGYH